MGPSQGKHSNMNALRVLARVRGIGVEELGLTTARPMYHPVPLKLLGRPQLSSPSGARRSMPSTRRRDAVWMPAGNWRRPEYYAGPARPAPQSIAAEVHAVRTARRPHRCRHARQDRGLRTAGRRVPRSRLCRQVFNLKVGMTRYGLMLDEAGVIIDDGVIARLARVVLFHDDHGGSATVFRELLR
jgi:sarcosine oxidase, subunit alpha